MTSPIGHSVGDAQTLKFESDVLTLSSYAQLVEPLLTCQEHCKPVSISFDSNTACFKPSRADDKADLVMESLATCLTKTVEDLREYKKGHSFFEPATIYKLMQTFQTIYKTIEMEFPHPAHQERLKNLKSQLVELNGLLKECFPACNGFPSNKDLME